MGLSPHDLTAAARRRPPVPTFADYVPVVSAAVADGTRRGYGTYWNRITQQWGTRHLDEPTPSELRQLIRLVKANALQRRNGRGGRSAEEHLVATLRCLYRHAKDDGLLGEKDSPAGCPPPAGPWPTPGLPRSTRSQPPPATTLNSTR